MSGPASTLVLPGDVVELKVGHGADRLLVEAVEVVDVHVLLVLGGGHFEDLVLTHNVRHLIMENWDIKIYIIAEQEENCEKLLLDKPLGSTSAKKRY